MFFPIARPNMDPYAKLLLLYAVFMECLCVFCSAGTLLPANWRDFIHPDVLATLDNDQSRYDSDLVEGDISGIEPGQISANAAANAVDDTTLLWRNNTIPYDFSTQRFARFSVSEHKMVEEAMQLIMIHTGQCVRFVPRTTEDDYIRFQKGMQSYSNIGRTGGKQAISLSSGCLALHGCIQHEIMHSLGFYHEQSRMDRDDYVLINFDNIAETDKAQFEKHTAGLTYNLPYDYESVMHFGLNAFAKDSQLPTVLPTKPGRPKLGQQEDLSPLDVVRIHSRYKCSVLPAKAFLELATPKVQQSKPVNKSEEDRTSVGPGKKMVEMTTFSIQPSQAMSRNGSCDDFVTTAERVRSCVFANHQESTERDVCFQYASIRFRSVRDKTSISALFSISRGDIRSTLAKFIQGHAECRILEENQFCKIYNESSCQKSLGSEKTVDCGLRIASFRTAGFTELQCDGLEIFNAQKYKATCTMLKLWDADTWDQTCYNPVPTNSPSQFWLRRTSNLEKLTSDILDEALRTGAEFRDMKRVECDIFDRVAACTWYTESTCSGRWMDKTRVSVYHCSAKMYRMFPLSLRPS